MENLLKNYGLMQTEIATASMPHASPFNLLCKQLILLFNIELNNIYLSPFSVPSTVPGMG